jgi:hypothetical protein
MGFHLLLPLPEEPALVLLAQLKWLSFRETGKKPKLQDLSCALLSSCKSWSRNAGMGGARAMSNAVESVSPFPWGWGSCLWVGVFTVFLVFGALLAGLGEGGCGLWYWPTTHPVKDPKGPLLGRLALSLPISRPGIDLALPMFAAPSRFRSLSSVSVSGFSCIA